MKCDSGSLSKSHGLHRDSLPGNPCINSSVPGVTPRVWQETKSRSTVGFIERSHQRSKPTEEMQSFTLCNHQCKTLCWKGSCSSNCRSWWGHPPPVPHNSHEEASQEILSWLSWSELSQWVVDDPFRIWFWPVAQIMSSSFGFMLLLPVTS